VVETSLCGAAATSRFPATESPGRQQGTAGLPELPFVDSRDRGGL